MIWGLMLFGIPAAIVAANKGFAALRWLLAFDLIGLIVVSCLSSASKADLSPEEKAARARKANAVGAWMCGLNLGLLGISVLEADRK